MTPSGRELRVRDGDLVRVGPATLRLSDPADRYLREIEAQAADEAPREAAGPRSRARRRLPVHLRGARRARRSARRSPSPPACWSWWCWRS